MDRKAENICNNLKFSSRPPCPGRPAQRGWRRRARGCCWCRWGWASGPSWRWWPPPSCPPRCCPGPPRVWTRRWGLHDSPDMVFMCLKSFSSIYLEWIKMPLHGLAPVGHVSELVDVEAVVSGWQSWDLSSDLHWASRAPDLNISDQRKERLLMIRVFTWEKVTVPEIPSPLTTATAMWTWLAWGVRW